MQTGRMFVGESLTLKKNWQIDLQWYATTYQTEWPRFKNLKRPILGRMWNSWIAGTCTLVQTLKEPIRIAYELAIMFLDTYMCINYTHSYKWSIYFACFSFKSGSHRAPPGLTLLCKGGWLWTSRTSHLSLCLGYQVWGASLGSVLSILIPQKYLNSKIP